MDEKLHTLPDKLREIINQFPDKIVMQIKKEDGYASCTYKQFYETSLSIAHSLLDAGIRKGDRVTIVLENRPEWGMIYFAILLAGGIAVPIDYQSSQEEIKFILSDSESRIVFVSSKYLSLFETAASLQKIVVLGPACAEVSAGRDESHYLWQGFSRRVSEKCVGFSRVMSPVQDSVKRELLPEVSPQDIASILYTSGTTGKPKGVMLTHKNFYSNFQSIAQLKLISDKDNIISILPLHHSFPFMVTLLIPLFSGSRITYILSLKGEELLECMRETSVTILTGVPQLFYMFYKHILGGIKKIPFFIRMPLSGFIEILWLVRKFTGVNLAKLALPKIHRTFGKNLRFFACGGAKLNEEVARFLVKIGFTILEGYGLTETSPVVTFNPLKKQKIGSVGKAIPEIELKITGTNKDGIGEVVIRGPNIMKGYYKQEEETRKVLDDGWFYSGDLGYLDEQGYLYITGRKKELIVLSSGKNISPLEVESHYGRSLFIKELCILAIGERGEEKLMAVIVPDLDYYRKVGEVNVYGRIKWDLDNSSKQLPSYKRIRGFIVVQQDLPRTRLGKLKRFEIKERYFDELLGRKLKKKEEQGFLKDEDLKILSSELGRKVIEVLAKEGKLRRQIRLDDHLEIDLGLDSLGRVEAMVAVEKILEIDIPESSMAKVFTVREFILEIEKLILAEKAQGKEVFPAKIETSLWSDLLKAAPDKDIIKKLNLSPGWIARVYTRLAGGMLYITFKIIWQLKVLGIKNLPLNKAFILCPNHVSYLDAFLVAVSLPAWLRKHTFFVGIRVYFEAPIIKDMVKLLRVIPIDPAIQLVDAMQACAYTLRQQKIVCIFPEGGRSIDGEIKEFKKGVGILAKELNILLVPVYISGSYESWPRGTKFPRPHPIKVIFGKPLYAKQLGDDYEMIAKRLKEEVLKLIPKDAKS